MATIQVRNVPEEVAEKFRRRAEAAGQSLQNYMLDQMIKLANRGDKAEIMAAVRDVLDRSPGPGSSVETVVAELRELRGD